MDKQDELAERYRRQGTDEWKQRGSALDHHRYAEPIHRFSRVRCYCCKRRATHVGMANGIALASGCEMFVARWVRNPRAALSAAGGGDE